MSPSERRRPAQPPLRLLQVVYGARRRAGLVADRLARRTNQLRRDPVADLPEVDCDFFAVLDGRTLHLHALLPSAAVPAPSRATLIFLQDAQVVECPATVEAEGDAFGVRVQAAFGTGNDDISLAKGVWSLALAVSGEAGEQQFALRAGESPEHDGPTVPAPPHPISGWRYEPGLGPHGLAQLTVAGAKARAEVIQLATGRTEARIQARLLGVRSLEDPVVVFTPRAGGADLVIPIDPVDGRFEFVVPLAELASGPPGTEVIWEAWVRTSPTRMIRLGRFLHDLRDPRTVLRVSRSTVVVGDRHFVGYRPYYTKAGNLAVACLHFTGAPT
ncbi:hypothetical protein AB0875_11010 [Micromonospora gifhornensis]|uniref:hypothetical protein n=1 Tax=Micromonospora gifhornensis TaxID=84594 RepID=UPI003453721E